MHSFLCILLIFSKLIVVKFLQELFFEIFRMFLFRCWKNPESLVDKKNMKSEYFLPGFHRAAAAVKSDANGIFHLAASEMNWIGRLSQIVKLILTGWGCWHSSWLLLTHTHTGTNGSRCTCHGLFCFSHRNKPTCLLTHFSHSPVFGLSLRVFYAHNQNNCGFIAKICLGRAETRASF